MYAIDLPRVSEDAFLSGIATEQRSARYWKWALNHPEASICVPYATSQSLKGLTGPEDQKFCRSGRFEIVGPPARLIRTFGGGMSRHNGPLRPRPGGAFPACWNLMHPRYNSGRFRQFKPRPRLYTQEALQSCSGYSLCRSGALLSVKISLVNPEC